MALTSLLLHARESTFQKPAKNSVDTYEEMARNQQLLLLPAQEFRDRRDVDARKSKLAYIVQGGKLHSAEIEHHNRHAHTHAQTHARTQASDVSQRLSKAHASNGKADKQSKTTPAESESVRLDRGPTTLLRGTHKTKNGANELTVIKTRDKASPTRPGNTDALLKNTSTAVATGKPRHLDIVKGVKAESAGAVGGVAAGKSKHADIVKVGRADSARNQAPKHGLIANSSGGLVSRNEGNVGGRKTEAVAVSSKRRM